MWFISTHKSASLIIIAYLKSFEIKNKRNDNTEETENLTESYYFESPAYHSCMKLCPWAEQHHPHRRGLARPVSPSPSTSSEFYCWISVATRALSPFEFTNLGLEIQVQFKFKWISAFIVTDRQYSCFVQNRFLSVMQILPDASFNNYFPSLYTVSQWIWSINTVFNRMILSHPVQLSELMETLNSLWGIAQTRPQPWRASHPPHRRGTGKGNPVTRWAANSVKDRTGVRHPFPGSPNS